MSNACVLIIPKAAYTHSNDYPFQINELTIAVNDLRGKLLVFLNFNLPYILEYTPLITVALTACMIGQYSPSPLFTNFLSNRIRGHMIYYPFQLLAN